MKKLDVLIIGAGTAGLSARKEVAKETDNYLVVDSGPLGTTCARVGCMPSKALIQVASDYYRRLDLEKIGIQNADSLKLDIASALDHVRTLRDRFTGGVKKSMESWMDTHFKAAHAQFQKENHISLDGEVVEAKSVIIATGSEAVVPQAWQSYTDYILKSDDLFEMKGLPKELGLVGVGVIGLELGQALSRLGTKVEAFSHRKSFGGLSDPQLQEEAFSIFSEEFPIHIGEVQIVGEKNSKLELRIDDQSRRFEKILLSVGRRPRLSHLGLENLELEMDSKGIPLIDPKTYQIPGKNISIVGDCNNQRPVLHEASDEGRIAGYNAVRSTPECFERRTRLLITFSEPNIAIVGQSFNELHENNIDFATGEVSYQSQGRALVMGKNKGLLRVYGDKNSGALLGAEICAPEGEHLAHLLSWAISLKLHVREALALPFYHPVLEEGLRTALRDLQSSLKTSLPPLENLRCSEGGQGH